MSQYLFSVLLFDCIFPLLLTLSSPLPLLRLLLLIVVLLLGFFYCHVDIIIVNIFYPQYLHIIKMTIIVCYNDLSYDTVTISHYSSWTYY